MSLVHAHPSALIRVLTQYPKGAYPQGSAQTPTVGRPCSQFEAKSNDVLAQIKKGHLMQSHHRAFIYESLDFKTMCALVVRDNAMKKEQFVWHVARLVDWKYNLGNFKRRFPGNYAKAAHLWFNYYDELIGFVLSEEFDNEFTILVLDIYSYLYPEMLAWVHSEWGEQYSQLTTCVVATHAAYITTLEQCGYTKTDEIEMTRMFDTCQFRDYPYPAAPFGFKAWLKTGITRIRGSCD